MTKAQITQLCLDVYNIARFHVPVPHWLAQESVHLFEQACKESVLSHLEIKIREALLESER